MEFKEVTTELDNFKDTDDYKNYVGGFVTADRVNQYLETEEGKKLIQPTLDKYHSKGLESWKTNNLQKMIDEEVKKRFPDADPKDIELQNVKTAMEQMKKEIAIKEVTNKALLAATERKIPQEFISYIVTDDEKATMERLDSISKVFNSYIATAVEEKLKTNSHIPPASSSSQQLTGVELEFQKRNPNIKI